MHEGKKCRIETDRGQDVYQDCLRLIRIETDQDCGGSGCLSDLSSKVEVGVVDQVNDGWGISRGRVLQVYLIATGEGIGDLCRKDTRVAIISSRTNILEGHTVLSFRHHTPILLCRVIQVSLATLSLL